MVFLYLCALSIILNIAGLYIWTYELSEHSEMPEDWFLPYRLHQLTSMNWFGSYFCSIVMLILFPVAYIIQFLFWLMHV